MEFAPGAGTRIRRSFVIDQSRVTCRPPVQLVHHRRPAAAWQHRGAFCPSHAAEGRRRTAGHAGLLLAMLALCGCATPSAADIEGRWRPLNRFADVPQAIPLQEAYVYQASPADGTLKAMLSRWARDARMTLSYEHPNDYTLHGPVGGIRTTNLEQAAATLSSAYADHGVAVRVERTQIVVSQRSVGDATAAPGQDG